MEELGYVVLNDEDYKKGVFLLRGQIMTLLKETFGMYGMDIYIPGAVEALVSLVEDWGQYIRGDLSKPISIAYVRRRK
jgi:hypothetical protein